MHNENNEQNILMNTNNKFEQNKDLNSTFNNNSEKKKRNRIDLEKKLLIIKKIRQYAIAGLTYREMQEKLKEDLHISLSIGALFNYIQRAIRDMISEEDAKRIFLERFEKYKLVEQYTIQLLNQAKDSPIKEKAYIIKTLSDILEKTDNYLARFGILSGIPVRQEVEVKSKVDVSEIIDYVLSKKEV